MSARRPIGLLATMLVVVVGGLAPGAGAIPMPRDFGVGIQAPPVEAPQPVVAGVATKLSPVYVVNTGTEDATIEVHVEAPLKPGKGKLVPKEWITFGTNDVALAAKADARIPITLSVPADAPHGKYVGRIVAGTTSAATSQGTGSSLGAAAATELLFTVGKPDSGGLPFPLWWVGAGLGAVAVVILIKRSGVRLRVERR